MTIFDNRCFGYCSDCGTTHTLGTGAAVAYAYELMNKIELAERLDIDVPLSESDPSLRTEVLFPGDRGHMFGVLETRNAQEETVWLKAFSSLKGGIRQVTGWVPPVLSTETYDQLINPEEYAIKELTKQIDSTSDSTARKALIQRRAKRSQALWVAMRDSYRMVNQQGKERGLKALFGDQGIPGGTGECCGPKLLCYANRNQLTPIGLVEFYWGPSTTYEGKSSGSFHPCCEPRCRPLLGFLLCPGNGSKDTSAEN